MVKTVNVQFFNIRSNKYSGSYYSYLFENNIESIEVGDVVIVPSKWNGGVGKVVEVTDGEDPKATERIIAIVGKVKGE